MSSVTVPSESTITEKQSFEGVAEPVATSLFGHQHWDAFSITESARPSGIRLEQTAPRSFRLDCDIRYNGPTGLDELNLSEDDENRLRTVTPATLPDTDLASVPAPFRWWSNTYGVHSPAALIHDRFIGEPAKGDPGRPGSVTERHIDRYFRFMLQASGVPFFRRWLMWAAVALRTRAVTSVIGLLSMVLWATVTAASIVGAVILFNQDRPWLALAALAVPIPASGLWARQFGAGLMMAYVGIPCLLPPSVGVGSVPPSLCHRRGDRQTGRAQLPLPLFGCKDDGSGVNAPSYPPPASPPPVQAGRSRTPSFFGKLFTTAHHPTRAIADPDLRRRYQRRRLIIAVFGGLLGGLGVGFTFSHTGLIGTGLETVALVPVALGVLLAVTFVVLPLPEIFRWVAVVGVMVVCIGLMDMRPELQLALGLVGFAVSWVVAVILQFGIGVARLTAKDFVTSLSGLALIVATGLAALLAAGFSTATTTAPAAAQAPIGAPCQAGQLTINVDGITSAFTAEGSADPIPLDIRSEDIPVRLDVFAESTLARGTVIVELIDVEPVPFIPNHPVVIWSGDLQPDSDGGTTDLQTIVIDRTDAGLTITADAHAAELGLAAGLGHYRATLFDPESGDTCTLDGFLRITASPVDTGPGRAGLAAAVVGLGMAAGSLLGGAVRKTERGPKPDIEADQPPDPSPSPLVDYAKPAVGLLRQRVVSSGNGSAEGSTYEVILQVRLEENDDNVYRIQQHGLRWVDMVDIGVVGALNGPAPVDIPIQVRTDPKKVKADFASLELNLVSDGGGAAPVLFSLTMPTGSGEWRLDTFGSGSSGIDLRDEDPQDRPQNQPPPPAPGTPPPTAPESPPPPPPAPPAPAPVQSAPMPPPPPIDPSWPPPPGSSRPVPGATQ